MFGATPIHTVAPPVVGPELDRDSHDSVPHPWFDESAPVILGVGRLTPNKRFELLLAALARLSDCRDIRLIILGRGPEEERLQSLAEQWGLTGRVDFPGYSRNPYAWMRRANVLALPSRVEPFGLVLIESLYLGTPFVAAGTPSGPRSIHQATGQGYLLMQDTAEELASAIVRVLNSQHDASAMRRAAEAYDYRVSSREYLRVMLSSRDTS
jgi:glycosyltransferase involved in cell wall biosynthesis